MPIPPMISSGLRAAGKKKAIPKASVLRNGLLCPALFSFSDLVPSYSNLFSQATCPSTIIDVVENQTYAIDLLDASCVNTTYVSHLKRICEKTKVMFEQIE